MIKFTIDSTKSLESIKERLVDSLEVSQPHFFSVSDISCSKYQGLLQGAGFQLTKTFESYKPRKKFRGLFQGDNFQLSRNCTTRNSLLPLVKGSIQNYAGHGRIVLRFSLFPLARIQFLVLLLIINFFISLLFLENHEYLNLSIFFLAEVFLIALAYLEFRLEVEKVKRLFTKHIL